MKRVAIVGTGVIGSGWAALFALRGFEVTAYVRSDASKAKFARLLDDAWAKLVARGLASAADARARRVATADTLAAAVRGRLDHAQARRAARRRDRRDERVRRRLGAHGDFEAAHDAARAELDEDAARESAALAGARAAASAKLAAETSDNRRARSIGL